jgi:hypothetical protein
MLHIAHGQAEEQIDDEHGSEVDTCRDYQGQRRDIDAALDSS